jgi:hypothetical protein
MTGISHGMRQTIACKPGSRCTCSTWYTARCTCDAALINLSCQGHTCVLLSPQLPLQVLPDHLDCAAGSVQRWSNDCTQQRQGEGRGPHLRYTMCIPAVVFVGASAVQLSGSLLIGTFHASPANLPCLPILEDLALHMSQICGLHIQRVWMCVSACR